MYREVSRLKDRDKEIIELRYGLNGKTLYPSAILYLFSPIHRGISMEILYQFNCTIKLLKCNIFILKYRYD